MELGPCDEHSFEMAENTCRTCARAFCGECLVYSFGPKKQPFCTKCAVSAAGIRKSSQRTKAGTKKQIRAQNKALKKIQKAEKKHKSATAAAPLGDTINWETLDADDSGVEVRQVDDIEPPRVTGGDLPIVAGPDDR